MGRTFNCINDEWKIRKQGAEQPNEMKMFHVKQFNCIETVYDITRYEN